MMINLSIWGIPLVVSGSKSGPSHPSGIESWQFLAHLQIISNNGMRERKNWEESLSSDMGSHQSNIKTESFFWNCCWFLVKHLYDCNEILVYLWINPLIYYILVYIDIVTYISHLLGGMRIQTVTVRSFLCGFLQLKLEHMFRPGPNQIRKYIEYNNNNIYWIYILYAYYIHIIYLPIPYIYTLQ